MHEIATALPPVSRRFFFFFFLGAVKLLCNGAHGGIDVLCPVTFITLGRKVKAILTYPTLPHYYHAAV